MTPNDVFRIAVFPGDGIGQEIMDVTLAVLDAVRARIGGFRLEPEILPAGAAFYRETGLDITDETLRKAGEADAILLGAMGLPDVRFPDGTEISPHLRMRTEFGLYAGVRPVKAYRGISLPLADERNRDVDLIVLRESTEGLFAEREQGQVIDDREARDTLVITRRTSERLFDFAFELARKRKRKGGKGKVTCVDKANVLRSMAFFRQIFDERAARFPDIEAEHRYVDAMALEMVRRPWDYDVLVMENMFADILSDLGGALVGGMGMAPCAEIGEAHALFQPSHGTAPDIAGTDVANPTAMIVSAAMMLDWLGERHDCPPCVVAAERLQAAVENGFADGILKPREFGGPDGTRAYARKLIELVDGAPARVGG